MNKGSEQKTFLSSPQGHVTKPSLSELLKALLF